MMREQVEKMLRTTDEFMGKFQQIVTMDSLKMMSSEDFEMMKLFLRLMDESKEVLRTEAKTLDSIEIKLDRLLSAKYEVKKIEP